MSIPQLLCFKSLTHLFANQPAPNTLTTFRVRDDGKGKFNIENYASLKFQRATQELAIYVASEDREKWTKSEKDHEMFLQALFWGGKHSVQAKAIKIYLFSAVSLSTLATPRKFLLFFSFEGE